MKKSVLGVTFTDLSIEESTLYARDHLAKEQGEPFHIITANPEIVMQINRDDDFKRIEQETGMITADGIGIIWGSIILGNKVNHKVRGVDFLVSLLGMCEKEGHSIYLLGADEATNNDMYEYVKCTYPNLKITGKRNGFFDTMDDQEIVETIGGSKTDFLIMAMGSPRAHKWFGSRKEKLEVKMSMDVGGSFDVLTGRVKRAPVWVQKIQMEWLYRRLQNPERAKRQKDLYRFVGEVFRERFSRNEAMKYGN